ncbi:hypothetical protein ATANTOWER_000087, partial [Ataeniobius toweri]|nr:hypothetical protein [Ataeniobius toweri]
LLCTLCNKYIIINNKHDECSFLFQHLRVLRLQFSVLKCTEKSSSKIDVFVSQLVDFLPFCLSPSRTVSTVSTIICLTFNLLFFAYDLVAPELPLVDKQKRLGKIKFRS